MSLMDETFPYDDIFDSKSRDSNDWEDLTAKNNLNDELKIVEKKIINTKNERQLKKFQSVNDLYSKNSMSKYKHVTSKVRQYITEMEEENKKRKSSNNNNNTNTNNNKKLPRINSLPTSTDEQRDLEENSDATKQSHNTKDKIYSKSNDEFGLSSLENLYQNHEFNIAIKNDANNNFTDDMSNNSNSNNNSNDHSATSSELMNKIYTEIKELRSLNEYLQTNLDNKIAQAAKLKRANDAMQIDIVHLQDKLKNVQHHHRNSLPESYLLWSQGKCTQATQTEDEIMMTTQEYHLDETYLFNLISSATDSLFRSGSVIKTPDLMKRSATTDDDTSSDNNSLNSIDNQSNNNNNNQLSVNQNHHCVSSNLRLRSNSNDHKKNATPSEKLNQTNQQSHIISNNGSDSAIESDTEIDEANNKEITANSMEPFLENNSKTLKKLKNNKDNRTNKNRPLKKIKKIRFFKKSLWQRLFGSCLSCRKTDSNQSQDGVVVYTQVNLSESNLYEADTTSC